MKQREKSREDLFSRDATQDKFIEIYESEYHFDRQIKHMSQLCSPQTEEESIESVVIEQKSTLLNDS